MSIPMDMTTRVRSTGLSTSLSKTECVCGLHHTSNGFWRLLPDERPKIHAGRLAVWARAQDTDGLSHREIVATRGSERAR
jgi:hypothetical protein